MSETQKSPPSLTGLVVALPGRIFRRDALLLVAAMVAGAAGLAVAQSKAKDEISHVAEAKVAPVKAQVEQLAVSVDDLRKQLAAKEARDAERWDAMYRAIVFGQRTARAPELAQPTPTQPDGGP